MRSLSLCLLLPLVACATPREQCERDATRDLSVIQALITTTQQNLARGYAIEKSVEYRPTLTFCYADRFGTGNAVFTYCNEIEPRTVKTPVAIDVAAEKTKLADLQRKEAELRKAALQGLATCATTYPEV